jgi:hypothetical protein
MNHYLEFADCMQRYGYAVGTTQPLIMRLIENPAPDLTQRTCAGALTRLASTGGEMNIGSSITQGRPSNCPSTLTFREKNREDLSTYMSQPAPAVRFADGGEHACGSPTAAKTQHPFHHG